MTQECEVLGQAITNKQNSVCWLMDWEMYVPMFNANMATFWSYLTISLALVLVLYMFRGLLGWIGKSLLISFTLFILSCGVGHLVKVYNFWWGDFHLELAVDQITALLSVVTSMYVGVGTGYLFLKYFKNRKLFESKMKEVFVVIGALYTLAKKENTPKYIKLKVNKTKNNVSEFISFQAIWESFPTGSKADLGKGKMIYGLDQYENSELQAVLLRGFIPEGETYSWNHHDCDEYILPIKGDANETKEEVPFMYMKMHQLGYKVPHGFKAKTDFEFYSLLIKRKRLKSVI